MFDRPNNVYIDPQKIRAHGFLSVKSSCDSPMD
jgi:hypothetical protein